MASTDLETTAQVSQGALRLIVKEGDPTDDGGSYCTVVAAKDLPTGHQMASASFLIHKAQVLPITPDNTQVLSVKLADTGKKFDKNKITVSKGMVTIRLDALEWLGGTESVETLRATPVLGAHVYGFLHCEESPERGMEKMRVAFQPPEE